MIFLFFKMIFSPSSFNSYSTRWLRQKNVSFIGCWCECSSIRRRAQYVIKLMPDIDPYSRPYKYIIIERVAQLMCPFSTRNYCQTVIYNIVGARRKPVHYQAWLHLNIFLHSYFLVLTAARLFSSTYESLGWSASLYAVTHTNEVQASAQAKPRSPEESQIKLTFSRLSRIASNYRSSS